MALGVTVSPTVPQPFQTVTFSVTGGAATTGYIAEIGPVATLAAIDGGTTIDSVRHTPIGTGRRVPFTTDGSGNATVTHVAQTGGAHTINIFLAPIIAAAGATAAFTVGTAP